jgi:hypothetical protein
MANEFKVKKGLIVDGTNTVLDIQGTQGQLFSVTDSLTGDLFSVSDISGIPILNVNSSGAVTIDGSLNLGDSDTINIGASNDLQIYHDGSHSYIRDQGSGNLIITGSQLTFSNVADTEYMAKMVQDGTVELYYNGSKKFETTNTGVTVTGYINATTTSGHSFMLGNSSNTSSADTSGFRLHQSSYSDGRYTHRFRKLDKGGGVPLYIDGSGSTANIFTALARFGTYTGESKTLEVFGTMGATNFSGSSSGTNTGDQTLPTASSLGAVTLAGSQTISGTKTINTLIIGTSAKIQFQNNDFIRYDDAANRWHFDVDGGSSNGSLQAATFVGALTGNAATATTLQTARTINGVSFNGSANITVADSTKLPLAGGTMTGPLELGVYGTTNQGVLKLNGSTANKQSVIKTTDGNLHIDAASGNAIYLNWYGGTQGTQFGDGSGASGASVSAGGVYTATGGTSTQWNTAYTHSQAAHAPSNANNYVHPTTAGNKHVPTGGSSGQFLKYSSSGTAVWAADNNTTYSVGAGGLTQQNFTTTLKNKLDGIAASANNYSLPFTNNSTNWNTAYDKTLQWDGSSTALTASTGRTSLGLGSLATLNSVAAGQIDANAVNASELNVSGNGTTSQYLRSDGDGTMSWVTPPDNNTVYTHPTTAGNKHIPTGGSSGQFLRYSASGTATWATPDYIADTNTTYSVGDGGLTQKNFTTTLKSKLDGIAASANNYVLPTQYFQSSSTGDVGHGGLQNWNLQESTVDLNPTTDWHTAIRIGHGDPVDYYSNTLAIQMTGGDAARIRTRNVASGTKGSWKKYWHDGDFSLTTYANLSSANNFTNYQKITQSEPKMQLVSSSSPSLTAGMHTQVGGQLLGYGTNFPQIVGGTRNTSYAGGFFRIDVRSGYTSQFFTVQRVTGTSTETVLLTVNSDGDLTILGNITELSDERLKSDIKTVDSALDKVNALRGVTFMKNGKRSLGVIAQEVEKVLPEVVIDGAEYKSVAYGNIVGVLIEAIKEQDLKIERLEKMVELMLKDK